MLQMQRGGGGVRLHPPDITSPPWRSRDFRGVDIYERYSRDPLAGLGTRGGEDAGVDQLRTRTGDERPSVVHSHAPPTPPPHHHHFHTFNWEKRGISVFFQSAIKTTKQTWRIF